MKRVHEHRTLTNAERHQRWIAKPGNKEHRKAYLQKWNAENKERNYLRKNTPKAKAAKKAYRQREEIRIAERARDSNRLRDPSKRAGRLYASAKGRAKKFGLPFTITPSDVEKLVKLGTCPYTNMTFDFSGPLAGMRKNPWSPSIDQKDPRKGYTSGNIEIVSTWWNLAKNEWPPEINQAAIAGLTKQYR